MENKLNNPDILFFGFLALVFVIAVSALITVSVLKTTALQKTIDTIAKTNQCNKEE